MRIVDIFPLLCLKYSKKDCVVGSYHSQLRGCINKVVSAFYHSWVSMRKGHSWSVLYWKPLLHSLHFLENTGIMFIVFVLFNSGTATSMILSYFTSPQNASFVVDFKTLRQQKIASSGFNMCGVLCCGCDEQNKNPLNLPWALRNTTLSCISMSDCVWA